MKCFLCGGDHSKDIPFLSKTLTCPFCKEEEKYMITAHCPGGVSHGETHFCPNCEKEVFITVYYDGSYAICKSLYLCQIGVKFNQQSEIEKTHKLNKHGLWLCKDRERCKVLKTWQEIFK